MNDFLFYALKSIAALGLFALVYRMLLGKEGNFPMRRLYLLSSILLAMKPPPKLLMKIMSLFNK